MRKKLYDTIDLDKTTGGQLYSAALLISILASLIPLCTKSTAEWTIILDLATVTVFIIDYILRLITADFALKGKGQKAFFIYPFTPMAIIDLLSILPSFGVLMQSLKILKLLRFFQTLKLFRALKIFRFVKTVDVILGVIKREKTALLTVGGFAFSYIFISALVVFNVEPNTFNSFFDAFYWACISLSTVGYGDIYPVTTAGRIVTMLSSFVGIAIVALPAGIITSGYMEEIKSSKKDDVQ